MSSNLGRPIIKLDRTSIVVVPLAGDGAAALATDSSTTITTTKTAAPPAAHGWSHGGFGLRASGAHGVMFQAAAGYLGLSQRALPTQLDNGKALAHIANTRGSSDSWPENARSQAQIAASAAVLANTTQGVAP